MEKIIAFVLYFTSLYNFFLSAAEWTENVCLQLDLGLLTSSNNYDLLYEIDVRNPTQSQTTLILIKLLQKLT